MTKALLLVGAPGTGKSTTLGALSSELERREIPHGSFETEQLSMGWPLLPASAWIPALTAVLTQQRTAGRDLFLLAATPESPSDLIALHAAIPADALHTVCLSAPPDVVATRLDAREPDSWPGKHHLITHARRLSIEIPTFPGISTTITTTNRSPASIAEELLTSMG